VAPRRTNPEHRGKIAARDGRRRCAIRIHAIVMHARVDGNFMAYLCSPDAQAASWDELQQLSAVSVAAVAGDCEPLPAASYAAIRGVLAAHSVANSGV